MQIEEAELDKVVNGGLSKIDCRILNRFRRLKQTQMKGYDIAKPLQLNQDYIDVLVTKNILTKGVAYQQFGRPPQLYTLTDLGEAVVEYMSHSHITYEEE